MGISAKLKVPAKRLQSLCLLCRCLQQLPLCHNFCADLLHNGCSFLPSLLGIVGGRSHGSPAIGPAVEHGQLAAGSKTRIHGAGCTLPQWRGLGEPGAGFQQIPLWPSPLHGRVATASASFSMEGARSRLVAVFCRPASLGWRPGRLLL